MRFVCKRNWCCNISSILCNSFAFDSSTIGCNHCCVHLLFIFVTRIARIASNRATIFDVHFCSQLDFIYGVCGTDAVCKIFSWHINCVYDWRHTYLTNKFDATSYWTSFDFPRCDANAYLFIVQKMPSIPHQRRCRCACALVFEVRLSRPISTCNICILNYFLGALFNCVCCVLFVKYVCRMH